MTGYRIGRSYHVLAVASKNLKIITLKPMQDQTEDTGKKKLKKQVKKLNKKVLSHNDPFVKWWPFRHCTLIRLLCVEKGLNILLLYHSCNFLFFV
jgi:hypothetical protein